MALVTSPNAAMPPFRQRPACDQEGASGHAAGTFVIAPDGAILLLRRSRNEENFPSHWALPGGNVDQGETPDAGAAREMKEEIGWDLQTPRKLIDQRRTPTGKIFHTFMQPIAEKVAPMLNGEHSGFTWAHLDDLPTPLHPAIADTLKNRVGIVEDMKPEDWAGLRDGLLKWLAEEESEPEHDANGVSMTGDSALRLAFDRDSVRSKRKDGQLVVDRAHITKATVNPYRGSEIPGFQQLGLDPDKIYNLLRHPDELKKAAPSLNGVQLLRKHIPVNAEDHRPYDTVGSLGTDAQFDGEYLDNSLFVNAQDAIDDIESGRKKQLSAGYHYTPDMTAGNFNGSDYDGIMRDIVFNHVALVEDGRAGPDVVVGDSAENIRMSKPTRLAALSIQMASAALAPLIAMDQKIALPKDLFSAITSKNLSTEKQKIIDSVKLALDGKLRKGVTVDTAIKPVVMALDALEDLMQKGADESVSEPQHNAMEAAAHGESTLGIPKEVGQEFAEADKGKAFDAEPLKAFLAQKGMAAEDIAKVCDMLPKPGLDSEQTEIKKEENGAVVQPAGAVAPLNPAGAKDMISKPAMDEAIKSAVAEARKAEQGVRIALSEVKPWVGDLPSSMAFDSGADVYRHALVMRGVANAKTMHADALLPVLQSLPKAGQKPPSERRDPVLATDSSSFGKAKALAPGLEHIQQV